MAVAQHQALVTVGMPVYNGERYLRESVEALRRQTLRDFELVISDNASTDGTAGIARELAAADPRIRYFRNDENVGVFRNYDLAWTRSSSRYFKWASGNDVCAPGYLEACVSVLESDPQVAIAYPGTLLFTDRLEAAQPYAFDPDVRDADPVTRFKRALGELRLNNAFNGVHRSEWLRETGLNGEYLGSDYVVVAEMALRGHIARVPGHLFYRRMTPEAASAAQDETTKRHFFVGTSRCVHGTPVVDRNRHLLRAIRAARLQAGQRLRALAYMARRFWWSRAAMWSELHRAAPDSR